MSGLERKCQLVGWFIFIASALFFMASSVASGDGVGFTGGLLFFIACIVFLYPLLRKNEDR